VYGRLAPRLKPGVGDGNDTRVRFGALFEVFLVISNIATAIVLFPILKRWSETLSLGCRGAWPCSA
jgi:hypothetical protein